MKIIRILCLALSLVMLLSLAACGESVDPEEDPTAGSTEAAATEAETDIFADLPTGHFDYEFTILQYDTGASSCTVIPREDDNTPLASTVMERAIVVGERLGVTFVNHLDGYEEVASAFRNNVLGGLDEYDVCWAFSQDAVTQLLTAGLLEPIDSASDIDLSRPWWDDTATDALRVGDKTYFAFGDIDLTLFDCHSTIIFDKELMDAMGKNLYEKVDNSTWTMDEFITLVTDCALKDENGTGWTRHGFEAYAYETMSGFLHGADVEVLVRDPDTSTPVLDLGNEQFFDVMSTYSTLFSQPICECLTFDYVTHFADRKTAMFCSFVSKTGALRGESFDYGILPYPKRTAGQKAYISFVSASISSMVLPATAHDIDRTGTVLENLAAESYRMVRPQYFDVMLKYKNLRDEESVRILEMLFDSETRLEIAHVYDWDDYMVPVYQSICSKDGTRFVSILKRNENKIKRAIEKTVKLLDTD